MFAVTLTTTEVFYLKGTTWTSTIERASKFDTKEQAQQALDKAAKFMKKSVVKLAKIETV